MPREDHPIVGSAVVRQSTLRPRKAVRDLDEFVTFLRRLQALHGLPARPRRPTMGDRFLL